MLKGTWNYTQAVLPSMIEQASMPELSRSFGRQRLAVTDQSNLCPGGQVLRTLAKELHSVFAGLQTGIFSVEFHFRNSAPR